MKKKIVVMILTFLIALIVFVNISNAQTIKDLTTIANSDLNRFLTMSIYTRTDGSTGSPTKNKAWYCLYEQAYGGNGRNMNTAIIDIGRTALNSVESNSSSYGKVSLTTSNSGANYAAQVIYLATKSYINNEKLGGGTQTAPYRHAMMYYASLYADSIKSARLFNPGLNGGTASYNEHISKYNRNAITEAQNYVNSTTNYKFSNQSKQNVQTIIEEGQYTFVGPYRIQKEGANSGEISSKISNVTVIGENGTKYTPDGWSTNAKSSSVNSGIELPNGQDFYLAFRNNKPDTVKKVNVTRTVTGGLRARFVFCDSDGGQDLGIYGGTFSNQSNNETIELPGVPFSNIKITKKDQDSGNGLSNVGFLVYCEGKGYVKDGVPSTYVKTKEEATTFISNANGEVTIRNLNQKGKYTIYEVVNPNFGFVETSVENPCQTIEVEISAVGQSVNQIINNKRKYVKLSGYVWEDMISQKTSIRNNLYDDNENDTNDKKLANVKVSLKKANGEIIDTKITDTNGNYKFGDYSIDPSTKKIEIDDLNGAYIEFEYNGMCYQSVKVQSDKENGSKATEEKIRQDFNNKFATITNNKATNINGEETSIEYTKDANKHESKIIYGTNLKYGYEGQEYPISGTYDKYMITSNTKDVEKAKFLGQNAVTLDDIRTKGIEEVQNINLGLYRREQPDLIVIKDVKAAKVTINGYTHLYNYEDRFNNKEKYEDGFNMSVKFETERGKESYTRAIYPTDTTYKSDDTSKELAVYLTYRIDIKNESSTVTTKVNSLIDYYDNNYELVGAGTELTTDGSIAKPIKWTQAELYNDKYNKTTLSTGETIEVEPQKSKTIYVQFKMSRQKVSEILFDANGEENKEKLSLDNVVEVNSYTSLENGTANIYAGIDKDSNPGNAIPGDKTTYEDDTESAPSFKLEVANSRKIMGTVFLDETSQELKIGEERLRRRRIQKW